MAVGHIHKTIQRTDILNHIQHNQTVGCDERSDAEGDADLEQFDTAAGRDTASHAAVAVVVESGNIRYGLAGKEGPWHRVRGLQAGSLQDSGAAVFGEGLKSDLVILSQVAKVTETIRQRAGKIREAVQKTGASFDASPAGEVLIELFRVLQPTDPKRLVVGQADCHHDAFDQDLGQEHVHLGNNVGDHLHVLFVGEDNQRVGALIRNNARISQQLDF